MNNCAENKDDVSLEMEQRLEELRNVHSNINDDPVVVAAKLRRWQNGTILVINKYFGELESHKFQELGSLDPDSNGDSIELQIKRWDSHLTALLDELYINPNLIILPQSIEKELTSSHPEEMLNEKSNIRRWTWNNIGSHPLRVIIATLLIAIPAVWFTCIEIRVKPLEKHIEFLKSPSTQSQKTKNFSYEVSPGSDSKKIYFSKSPLDLWRDIQNMTPEQSRNFVRNEYKGRWISFRAPVHYVYQSEKMDIGTINFDNGKVEVRVIVSKNEVPKLNEIFRGRKVSIEARFKHIMNGYVAFDKGRILKP